MFFLTKSQILAKKQENYNPAHKMVETFRNFWVLLIHVSSVSHIID